MEDSTWACGGGGVVKRLPRESSILRGVHEGPVELSCLSHFCSFFSLFFFFPFLPMGFASDCSLAASFLRCNYRLLFFLILVLVPRNRFSWTINTRWRNIRNL